MEPNWKISGFTTVSIKKDVFLYSKKLKKLISFNLEFLVPLVVVGGLLNMNYVS